MLDKRKPDWLRAKLPVSHEYKEVREIVDSGGLHTVCKSAQCPNLGECWSRRTATIMILGNICTRSCRFCAIQTGRLTELDLGEPARVAESIAKMGLQHAVITSVARDDLKDGGAAVWASTIRAVHHRVPECAVEILTADFRGQQEYLDIVLDASPDIFNHNLETVERLQRPIRRTARYGRSLWTLEHAKSRGFITKTGIMLGIGEKEDEIRQVLRDMASVGVDVLTIGQYLQPSSKHEPVDRWVHPDEFQRWKEFALEVGFGVCESGPLVRSSYHAEEQSAKYDVRARRRAMQAEIRAAREVEALVGV